MEHVLIVIAKSFCEGFFFSTRLQAAIILLLVGGWQLGVAASSPS